MKCTVPLTASLAFICMILIFSSALQAGVPELINYQGRLTDSGGDPLDTTVAITFTIYDAATDGNSKWTETHPSVIVVGGLFNVILGGYDTPIPDTVFNNETRYLGITVGEDAELSERTRIVSVGYAMHAGKADTADVAVSAVGSNGWTDDGSTVRLTTETDVVRVGPDNPTTPSLKFDVRGHGGTDSPLLRLYFESSTPTDLLYPALQLYQPSYDHVPFQVLGAGAIVQKFSSNKRDITTTVTIDPDPSNYTFFNAGHVGIGTDSPSRPLTVGDGAKDAFILADGSNAGIEISALSSSEPYLQFQVEGTPKYNFSYRAGSSYLRLRNIGNASDVMKVYDSDDRVIFTTPGLGIGVDNPTRKLDVNGSIRSREDIYSDNTVYSDKVSIGTTSTTRDLTVGDGAGDAFILVDGTNAGIEVSALSSSEPYVQFQVEGTPKYNFSYRAGSGYLRLRNISTATDVMQVYDSDSRVAFPGSFVGIGTSDPDYELDVNGDARVSGTLYATVDNADNLDGIDGSKFLYDVNGANRGYQSATVQYADNAWVTFDTPFSYYPTVVATAQERGVIVTIESWTATGFRIRLTNHDGTTFTGTTYVHWIAIGNK
jgi:hypothetical protein